MPLLWCRFKCSATTYLSKSVISSSKLDLGRELGIRHFAVMVYWQNVSTVGLAGGKLIRQSCCCFFILLLTPSRNTLKVIFFWEKSYMALSTRISQLLIKGSWANAQQLEITGTVCLCLICVHLEVDETQKTRNSFNWLLCIYSVSFSLWFYLLPVYALATFTSTKKTLHVLLYTPQAPVAYQMVKFHITFLKSINRKADEKKFNHHYWQMHKLIKTIFEKYFQ